MFTPPSAVNDAFLTDRRAGACGGGARRGRSIGIGDLVVTRAAGNFGNTDIPGSIGIAAALYDMDRSRAEFLD